MYSYVEKATVCVYEFSTFTFRCSFAFYKFCAEEATKKAILLGNKARNGTMEMCGKAFGKANVRYNEKYE